MLEELLSEAKRLNKERDNYVGGVEEEIVSEIDEEDIDVDFDDIDLDIDK